MIKYIASAVFPDEGAPRVLTPLILIIHIVDCQYYVQRGFT